MSQDENPFDARQRERAKYNLDYFENHYWREDLPGQFGNRGLHYDDPKHEKRFTFISELLLNSFSFSSVLDAGCGIGLLTKLLNSAGKRTIALDVSSAACRIAKKSSEQVIIAGIEAIPLVDQSVDLVFCSDVLEHLLPCDLNSAVTELCRVTAHHLILTINLDNPYEYHPSILTRDMWLCLFSTHRDFLHDLKKERELQSCVRGTYQEYDCFVFRRER